MGTGEYGGGATNLRTYSYPPHSTPQLRQAQAFVSLAQAFSSCSVVLVCVCVCVHLCGPPILTYAMFPCSAHCSCLMLLVWRCLHALFCCSVWR